MTGARAVLAIVVVVLASTSASNAQFIQDRIWVRANDQLVGYDSGGWQAALTNGLPTGNWGTCVDGFGNVWSTNFVAGSNTITKTSSTGAFIGTYPAGPSVSAPNSTAGPVCVDKLGFVYVGATGGNTVTVLDQAGNQVNQFTVGGSDIRTMSIDVNGDLWLNVYVRNAGFGYVMKYTTTGAHLLSLITGGFTTPNQVWPDEWGRVTVSHWPVTSQTTQFDLAGNQLQTFTSWGTSSNLLIGVAPNGNVWIGGYSALAVYSRSGALITSHPVSFPGSIAFDGFGNVWVARAPAAFGTNNVVELRKYDENGVALQTINVNAPPTASVNYYNIGDFTGMQYARVVDPLGDMDGDGFLNRDEVLAKSSPMDPLSFPQVPVFAVSAPPIIGQALQLTISVPLDAGMQYVTPFSLNGSAFGLSQVTPADPRVVGLSPFDPITGGMDLLWSMSTDPTNPVFNGTLGVLNAVGEGFVQVQIPNDPMLVGLQCYSVLATMAVEYPSSVKTLTNRLTITVL